MKRISTTPTALPSTNVGAVGKAWDEVSGSFDRFCLAAGVEALGAMMEKDAEEACGARHARSESRRGHRWGRTQGKIGFQHLVPSFAHSPHIRRRQYFRCCANSFHGVAFLCGIDTPSLPAQGEQRRSFYFNISRGIPEPLRALYVIERARERGAVHRAVHRSA